MTKATARRCGRCFKYGAKPIYIRNKALTMSTKYMIIVAMLSLSACQQIAKNGNMSGNVEPDNPTGNRATNIDLVIPQLDQTVWQITSLNGKATEGIGEDGGGTRNARIEFAAGNAGGSSGCNSFGGLYAQIEDRLYFGRSITTAMGCGGSLGIQENNLYSLLSGIVDVHVDPEGSLLLTNGTQQAILKRDKDCINCASARQSIVNLVGPVWKIQTVNGKEPIGRNVFKNESDYVLKFTADGYQFRVGCNYISGSYQKDGNRLVTQSGVSTLIGCPPGLAEQEQLVSRILSENPIIVHGFNMDMMLASKAGMLELQGPPDQRK
jgi:heat shock protein HslJ